ncbi:MAG: NAD(P)/FAD-dependent oxidoreductase, partial [Methyloligellaceae bacterium]
FLIQQIRENGGVIVEDCGNSELLMDDNGEVITGVQFGQSSFAANLVIVATGPDTPKALSMLTGHDFEARFPMTRSPGLLVHTPSCSPRRLANHILQSPDKALFHVRPNSQGGLLLGADDTDGMVTEESNDEEVRRAAAVLLERTREVIPVFPGAEILDKCTLKVGMRALPQDGNSVIGPILGVEGLILAMTHSGITLAPGLAKIVAEFVENGKWPSVLLPFSFDRFQAAS